jgi:hypothetical protein
MKVITNNQPRLLIDAYQLTLKERKEFDYLDWRAIDKGTDSATFFRYGGDLYDLGNFMRVPEGSDLAPWEGYYGDSYFSGTLIKQSDDSDYVIVGRYYS